MTRRRWHHCGVSQPVHAVRGNVHLLDFSDGGAILPATVELELAGHHIVITHGHWPGLLGLWFKGWTITARLLRWRGDRLYDKCIARRLARLYPDADVIIFGHTHRAHVEWIERTLLVNPGAVCPTFGEQQTVARMWLGEGRPQVEIVYLPCADPAVAARSSLPTLGNQDAFG